VEAQHPDDFTMHLLGLATGPVCGAIHRLRGSLRNPPKNVGEYLDVLERQSLPQTVARLRELKELI